MSDGSKPAEIFMIRSSLFCLLLLPLGANAQPKKYALLLGVNAYDHAEMNQPAPLTYAEADVKELAQLLRESGYEVDLLVGKDATRTAINAKIAGLAKKGNASGVVLVALAGHGVQLQKEDDAYYCPFDTGMRLAVRDGEPVKDRNGKQIVEPDPATLVKLTDIVGAFRLAPAGARILLADCCRNDPTTGRGRGVGTGIKTDLLPDNTAVLLSCSKGQQAFESKKWEHGAFFYHVLRGLREGNGTATALSAYLEAKVANDVKTTLRDAPVQVPHALINASNLNFGVKAVPSSSSGVKTPESKDVPAAVDLVDRPKVLKLLDSTEDAVAAADAKAIQRAWAERYRIDIPLKVKFGGNVIEFVLIPPGVFDMSSQRRVKITKPFLLSACEVKQAEYAALMGRESNLAWFRKKGGVERITELANIENTDGFPVENVSWLDAQSFAAKLLPACKKALPNYDIAVRLPTEAEWEYAGRAGATTPFQGGKRQLGAQEANFSSHNLRRTTNCGQFAANPFGLHDMHGNVAEWCQDAFEEKLGNFEVTNPLVEPKPNDSYGEHVVRGGSWSDAAGNCELSSRKGYRKDYRSNFIGFRIAIALPTLK